MPKKPQQLAKLSRPRLYDALPRERLFRDLDGKRRHPITWVSGPPGAGKSTLVASYLSSRQLDGIWYQVDPGDDDPATFFYYLGLAFRALPRVNRKAPLPLLTPEYLSDIPGFARRYFRALFSRLGPASCLVLDNFHEVDPKAPLAEILNVALEELPHGFRTFLISRGEPFDRFARLSANRLLVRVDWEKLRLTDGEAFGILRSARIKLDARTRDSLICSAGGWAAGFMLLIERLRRGDDVEPIDGPEPLQEVFAYFAAQLFEKFTAEDQAILLRLSFLPSISESMALQICGLPRAVALLEQLYRRQLFTDRRAGTPVTYQFHALFRAFLRHRAASGLSLEDRQEALSTAGLLLDYANLPEAALPLLVQAGKLREAESLINRRAATVIGQGRWKVVVDWIGLLPSGYLERSPWLLHWLGMAQIGIDPERAWSVLEQAHSAAVECNDVPCLVQIAAGMVETIFLQYAAFKPLDCCIPDLELMRSSGFSFTSLEMELRAQSALLIALTYRMPDHPHIDACATRVRELMRAEIEINLRVSAATHLALYGSMTGHLEESRRAARALVPLLANPSVTVIRKAFAWAVITWHACNTSDHELGLRAVFENEALARNEGIHVAERFACIIGFFLDMDRRDVAGAERRINRFEEIMVPAQPYEAASLVNMKAWHGVLTGNCSSAMQHATQAVLLYREAGSIPHILMGLNGLIWGCVESGDDSEARRWIAEHRQWSSRENMEWAQWSPDAAEAVLARRDGDHALLKAGLLRLFHKDRHGLDQYGHMLTWCRDWAAVLASEALAAGVHEERVCRYIDEYRLAPPSSAVTAWPWRLKIYALGSFEIHKDGAPLTFPTKAPRKLLSMLKCIVALGGEGIAQEKIADALWPNQDGDAAHQSFATSLHRLRKLLGDSDCILQRDGRISINREKCWIDAYAFEELCGIVEADAGSTLLNGSADAATRALALYRATFLDGEAPAGWLSAAQAAYRLKFIRLIETWAARLEQGNELDAAANLYHQGIEADPAVEAFYAGLIRCYRDLGHTAEALSVYQRLRQTLAATFDAQPSWQTETLVRSIQARL